MDQGKAKIAAVAIKAMLDGLKCSDDERLTVLANLAAWAWQDVATADRHDALMRWFAIIARDVEEAHLDA